MAQQFFFDKNFIIALFRLHSAFEIACKSYCDLSVLGCATLAAADLHGKSGLPIKNIKELTGHLTDTNTVVAELVDRELATRFRHREDRRALAIVPTSKGRERLQMADQILSYSLLWLDDQTTPAQFQLVVDKMHALEQSVSGKAAATTLVTPAAMLYSIQCRRALIDTSTRYGMTSLQACILLAIDSAGAATSFEDLVDTLQAPEETVEFQVQYLVQHGLVVDNDDFFITEKGQERQGALLRQYNTLQQQIIENMPQKSYQPLRELIDTLLYLYS